jgi:hypothetical protein
MFSTESVTFFSAAEAAVFNRKRAEVAAQRVALPSDFLPSSGENEGPVSACVSRLTETRAIGGVGVGTNCRVVKLAFLNARVPFSSPGIRASCKERSTSATSSPEDAVRRADHTASPWLDLAEGRLRLDRLRRNGGRNDFLPLAFGHSSRGKKVHRRHPPLRSGPEATPSRERDGDPDRRVRRRSPSASRSPSRPRWSRARNS